MNGVMKKVIVSIGGTLLILAVVSCARKTIDSSQPRTNLVTMTTEKGRAYADKSVAAICAKKPTQSRVKYIQTVCASSDCMIKAHSYSCIQ